MIKKQWSEIFLIMGFVLSITFIFLCLWYIIDFYQSRDTLAALNMINTFGNLSQKSLLFCTFSAVASDIIKKNTERA